MSLRLKSVLTFGFSFAAGWSDVVCFVRYGSFAALMTGNTIKAGIAAATESDRRVQDTLYYLCILMCYISGGTIFHATKARAPKHIGKLMAIVCLGLNILAEVLNQIFGNDKWQVCVLAPTFGIQNSLTFGGAMQTNTTIITGNMQKLSVALYQLLSRQMDKKKLMAIATPAAAIVTMFLSAIAGAVVLMDFAKMNAAWLFMPAGVLQAIMLVIHDKVMGENKGPLAAGLANSAASSSGAAPQLPGKGGIEVAGKEEPSPTSTPSTAASSQGGSPSGASIAAAV
eukprot:TRINITY_DN33825_c0_g1_i1.p1 TRINITY_DN33825_c0_g1~~TRINITY_DN33825_c0_g1_i1.p1  ORF type:complete len:284 (+),score=66.29 TRINITY_DN33825_c0_g1_i1:92-943(+)